mmetsp:Transcript_17346/g.24579  ORF Transcript_17346/g.24579 Transcript_17346/m.24579 type:complete len:202 (-) Transcript_17346:843-1448(-)
MQILLISPEKSRSLQVIRHDNCSCRIQNKLHIIRISRTCHMNKGIIELIINQTILELLDEVKHTMIEILRWPGIIRKRPLRSNVTIHDLFGKYIPLVQKEHDGSIGKGTVVTHTPEQFQSLHHTVGALGLGQCLIILAKCSNEDDGSNLIKAINPLSSFRTLSSHIIHFKVNAIDTITFHDNLRCSYTCDEYILGGRFVIR